MQITKVESESLDILTPFVKVSLAGSILEFLLLCSVISYTLYSLGDCSSELNT